MGVYPLVNEQFATDNFENGPFIVDLPGENGDVLSVC